MVVRLRVSEIMLAKPMTIKIMMDMEKSPPVSVLYCVSALYLSISEEQNMSLWYMSLLSF